MNSPAVEHRHTLSAPPPGLTREVRTDWIDMGMTTRSPDHYDPDLAADLPEPVRRRLAHAIVPGTPLLSSVELTSHGRLRLGSWREFTATQRQTAALGGVWAGDTRMYGLPATGFERYRRGDLRRVHRPVRDHRELGPGHRPQAEYTVDHARYR